jgi:hypothetical protein
LPVLYGTRIIELNQHVANDGNSKIYALPEGTQSIISVYDENMNLVQHNSADIIIHNSGFYTIKTQNGKYVKVTGYNKTSVGSIIKDLITVKGGLLYSTTYFNILEIDKYMNLPDKDMSILITGGTVNNAVNEVLKNDMAYLIQQSSGKFSIRCYGEIYNSHDLKTEIFTKKPEKDFAKAQENYFSSCLVGYKEDGFNTKTYLFSGNENQSVKLYSKRVIKEFNTELTSQIAAKSLAEKLSSRYSKLKSRIKVSVGIDTSDMELLDIIHTNLNINGRLFSGAKDFYIVEINPAQDILVLEEM